MTLKKEFKYSPDFKNKIKASATLHQGNKCDGTNPVNVTISWIRLTLAFFCLCGCCST